VRLPQRSTLDDLCQSETGAELGSFSTVSLSPESIKAANWTRSFIVLVTARGQHVVVTWVARHRGPGRAEAGRSEAAFGRGLLRAIGARFPAAFLGERRA